MQGITWLSESCCLLFEWLSVFRGSLIKKILLLNITHVDVELRMYGFMEPRDLKVWR